MRIIIGLVFVLAFGCAQKAEVPEETAEAKNRRVVEMVLGPVEEAEWRQARQESTDPDRHVEASQIIHFRAEKMKREVDETAKEATDGMKRKLKIP